MKKLDLFVFPYRVDVKGIFFPIIPLTFNFAGKKRGFFALIDSGATISVFRTEVANSLGIDILKGKEVYLGGVGGRIKGYIHRLSMEIAGKTFPCPIVFSDEYTVSFNLLGREAVFEKFRIIFEEKKNRLTLE